QANPRPSPPERSGTGAPDPAGRAGDHGNLLRDRPAHLDFHLPQPAALMAGPPVRASAGAEPQTIRWRWCLPSANSSIIFRLNAGMSSGLRLVTSPLSATTSWSTQFAPALRRSV